MLVPTQLVRVLFADQISMKPVLFVIFVSLDIAKCLFVWDRSYICSVVHKTQSMMQRDLLDGDAANFRRLRFSCMFLLIQYINTNTIVHGFSYHFFKDNIIVRTRREYSIVLR